MKKLELKNNKEQNGSSACNTQAQNSHYFTFLIAKSLIITHQESSLACLSFYIQHFSWEIQIAKGWSKKIKEELICSGKMEAE